MRFLIPIILLSIFSQSCRSQAKSKKVTNNVDKILAIEDKGDAALALFDILPETVEEGNDFQKNVLLALTLDGEVRNGGFSQYFFNSSGAYVSEALVALEKINATNTLQLLKQAIQHFPKSPIPKDTGDRRDLMDELPEEIYEEWDAIDTQFYDSKESIDELVIEYVKKNKSKFE